MPSTGSSEPAAGTPNHPFWDFSLALYGREGVAQACVALQDRRGLDVNLLLFCCWAGSRGRRLDPADLKGLNEAVGPWRDAVVRPLRAIRRWLKSQAAALATPGALGAPAHRLRERIKTDELQAEAVEQALLARTLPIPDDPNPAAPIPDSLGSAAAIAHNILAYVTLLEIGLQPADRAELAAILGACCPNLGSGMANSLLNDLVNGIANRREEM